METKSSKAEFGILDAMTKALYDVRVKEARKKIAELVLPCPRIEETLIEARDCGDDRTSVIIIFALVEDLLLDLIKLNLNKDMKGGVDKLFFQNGVLSTASSRISIIAALDWISVDVH